MKTRTSLVSNSSSQSFIIRGIKVSADKFRKLIKLDKFSEEHDKVWDIDDHLIKQYQSKLEVIPDRNYFNFDEQYTDIIVGLRSKLKFEDGDVVQLKETDEIDHVVYDEFRKIGFSDPYLSTFIQYVSNDNA